MEKKMPAGIMLALLLISMLTLAFNVLPVKAFGTIYIRADGSVDPPTAPISSVDNVTYTITGIIYSFVVVQRDNIVVDGAHYLLYGDGAYDSRGIDLAGRRNVTIKNCRIQRYGHGIFLDSSLNNTILGNNISGLPNNRVGITVHSSKDNKILGNYIAQNGMAVAMSSCSNSTISGNNVENNYDGFHLEHLSNNTFCRNNITGHESYGILFYYSTNNTVSENNMTNNGQYSIAIGLSSSYNSIYHNNFGDKPIKVYTSDCMNVWDNGYPSGGNYWSDYSTRYPGAQELDDSGIWDTPYIINGNNRDNYPLMEPWSPTPETVVASVLIDYGNGTRMLHANLTLLAGSSILNATLAVAQVDYISYGELGVFVVAINDVRNDYPHCWVWWYWDSVESAWLLGLVASNQYTLSNGEIIAWFYENVEIWPLPQPPWTPIEPVVTATVDIDPDTLNLKSNGKWITAYIQLPEGYNAADLNASAILLNGTIAPDLDSKYDFVTNSSEYLVDHNGDGVFERMVKFDRASAASWIYWSVGMQHEVSLTLTGELTDGTPFEGIDTIFVFWQSHKPPFKR